MQRYWSLITINQTYLTRLLLVGLAYLVTAKIGLSLATVSAQVTTIWPPSGIAVVALLLWGRKYWPAIYVASFITNLTTHEPLLVAAGVAGGDTLEALTALYFLNRYHFRKAFATPRDGIVFFLACGYGAVVAALIGPLSLALGGVITSGRYWLEALTWWQGDLMGLLVFGPAIIVYCDRASYSITRGRTMEFGLMIAITFAVAIGIFASRGGGPISLPFLLFPLLVWAAIRFTQIGVVSSALLITLVAIWGTINSLGPFAKVTSVAEELFALQAYACVLMASSMVMATAITERLAVESALREQTEELGRLDAELTEANKRVTNILEGILSDGKNRRRT